MREVYAVLRVRRASEARTEAKLPFLRIKGNLLMVGKRSPKPSMRVRLLLPLYERKALAFLFYFSPFLFFNVCSRRHFMRRARRGKKAEAFLYSFIRN